MTAFAEDVNGPRGEFIGYTTREALQKLYDDLTQQLNDFEESQKKLPWKEKFRKSFIYHTKKESILHWTSCVVVVTVVILLLISYILSSNRNHWLVGEALFLVVILACNIYFLIWDDRLKSYELVDKTRLVLKNLEGCIKPYIWNASNYLNLHIPQSPCVTLQWTYRDGEVVNLPCNLLVTGDVILLRPGLEVPVKCYEMEEPQPGEEPEMYSQGDIYSPVPKSVPDVLGDSLGKIPLKPKLFIVDETPYQDTLRDILEKCQDKPTSVIDNERHIVCRKWLGTCILPVIAIISLIVNTLRFVLLGEHVGHWTEMLITSQVNIMLPLLPLMVPICWKLLDNYGLARVMEVFNKAKRKSRKCTYDSFDSENDIKETHTVDFDWRMIRDNFMAVLTGTATSLPRTSNIVHALGNMTCLCCVDKKGILSWSNLSPEKVYFLTHKQTLKSKEKERSTQSVRSSKSSQKDPSLLGYDTSSLDEGSQTAPQTDVASGISYPEVLDLTQDPQNEFGLLFDDPLWRRHLNSLKPLGLNILLNACNMDTSQEYSQYADHITSVAYNSERSVAVVNRRCLCELARKIGFTTDAMSIFKLQQNLAMYRDVPQESMRDFTYKNKIGRHRVPMPNMFSTVVQETNSGMLQLMSQGTADILLDSCSDFWDGNDICPLTEADRKKILDFYHRTSTSSYCMAFSYRPLTQTLHESLGSTYIELPDRYRELYPAVRSPTPPRSWDVQSLDSRLTKEKRCYSADSLMSDGSNGSIQSLEGCFKTQCNQIFIGMVTMQYQARQDIVSLVEQLEMACIRFVHFSKENELRSRVFSEKMGLEAGWNCHVSLKPDKSTDNLSPQSHSTKNSQSDLAQRNSRISSRPSTDTLRELTAVKLKTSRDSMRHRCSSAPGGINTDMVQVSFNIDIDSNRTSREGSAPAEHSPPTIEVHHHDNCDDTPTHKISTHSNPVQIQNSLGGHDIITQENIEEELSKSQSMPSQTCDPQEQDGDSITSDDVHSRLLPQGGEDMDRRSWVDSGPISGSHHTSSCATDDSMTGGYDMTNRAKLPKGIENVRPHLQHVDNVPLLVSLFTDCTAEATTEMFDIMQDYGEVVCCIGSSVNTKNTPLYLKADISFSVDPLYPHVCIKEPIMRGPWEEKDPSPMDICSELNSIPCALSFDREDNISIVQLIAESRRHCMSMRNTFQFMLLCYVSISMTQLIGSLVQLPPLLQGHQILWLTCIIVPLLSLTLMGNPMDTRVMTLAQGKNASHIKKRIVFQFLLFNVFRFLPSILICVLCYTLTLNAVCESKQHSTCSWAPGIYGNVDTPSEGSTWHGWSTTYTREHNLAQHFLVTQAVLYFSCTSLSFIHRDFYLWKRPPFVNKLWCIMTPCLIVIQMIYFMCHVVRPNTNLGTVPLVSWLLATLWLLVLVPLNELVKMKEIKSDLRYQRRARLHFGTKLGMNSPF